HRGVFENVIPGVLKQYDLPDLVASLAPRPVWLVDTINPAGVLAPLEGVKAEYSRAKSVRIVRRRPGQNAAQTYGAFVAAGSR
ncbi:MAG: alpha/beta hydrolase family protein, partial [Bryobacteraceae bacterium]